MSIELSIDFLAHQFRFFSTHTFSNGDTKNESDCAILAVIQRSLGVPRLNSCETGLTNFKDFKVTVVFFLLVLIIIILAIPQS